MTDSGFNNQSTVNIGLVAMVEWRCGSYQPYGECKWESEQSYYACPEECPPKPLFAMCGGEQYHHYITGGYDNRYCQAFMVWNIAITCSQSNLLKSLQRPQSRSLSENRLMQNCQ